MAQQAGAHALLLWQVPQDVDAALQEPPFEEQSETQC